MIQDILPEDAYRLFEEPVVTVVTVLPTNVLLLPIDPTRVELYMTSTVGSSLQVSPARNAGANNGIFLSGGLRFSYDNMPRLCQSQWTVLGSAGGGTVVAVSVSLRRPPALYGYGEAFVKQTGPDVSAPGQLTQAPGVRRRPVRGGPTRLPDHVAEAMRRRCPNLFRPRE